MPAHKATKASASAKVGAPEKDKISQQVVPTKKKAITAKKGTSEQEEASR